MYTVALFNFILIRLFQVLCIIAFYRLPSYACVCVFVVTILMSLSFNLNHKLQGLWVCLILISSTWPNVWPNYESKIFIEDMISESLRGCNLVPQRPSLNQNITNFIYFIYLIRSIENIQWLSSFETYYFTPLLQGETWHTSKHYPFKSVSWGWKINKLVTGFKTMFSIF